MLIPITSTYSNFFSNLGNSFTQYAAALFSTHITGTLISQPPSLCRKARENDENAPASGGRQPKKPRTERSSTVFEKLPDGCCFIFVCFGLANTATIEYSCYPDQLIAMTLNEARKAISWMNFAAKKQDKKGNE